MTNVILRADAYMQSRTGCYEYRAVRYGAAGDEMVRLGLTDTDTVYDLGAGMTELDYTLRVDFGWRGRYIPVDQGIDGTDIQWWTPRRNVEFTVALEFLEHLPFPEMVVENMQAVTSKGIVVSVPNPENVDVLGIDDTHVTIVTREMLEGWGFAVYEQMFYGGVFSGGKSDSLLGVWAA